MLRNRIITGLILAPLAVGAVFYLPDIWFAVVFWVVTALAIYEWSRLFNPPTLTASIAYLVAYFGLCAVLYHLPAQHGDLIKIGCVLWLLCFVGVLVYPKGKGLYAGFVLAMTGLALMSIAWLALIQVRQAPDGAYWVLWVLLVVWGADVGAYFGGRAFGRHALAPAVSPGKTWEGVAGGYLLAGGVCGLAVFLWQEHGLAWVAITLALIAISVFGDLFESVLKRATGVKDSGTLLPGHGGMLDRIDSVIAVLPFFALAQWLM